MPLKVFWDPFSSDDFGPLIKVIVMPPAVEMDAGRLVGLEYPRPVPIKALIDTGSPFTIVNRVVAKNFNLRQTNPHVPLRTLGGPCTGEEYCCSMSFPGSDLPKIEVMGIVAADLKRERYYSCLIGRDVIRNWNIEFDGRSQCVTISA
ncbi:MAG TPA: hypothetical protein VMA34_12735 [Terracidiphilus sp.]|nr:hypothetical protein [Terracidiphilus sp.]